jgi:hypothetical protein
MLLPDHASAPRTVLPATVGAALVRLSTSTTSCSNVETTVARFRLPGRSPPGRAPRAPPWPSGTFAVLRANATSRRKNGPTVQFCGARRDRASPAAPILRTPP